MVVPTDWKVVRVGDHCDANWGNTAITKSSYVDSGVTAFSASGPDGFVSWHEHNGDGLVLSAIGALCGKTWLAQGKWTPIKNTIWIKSKSSNCSTRYVYHATSNPEVWPSRGAAQPFIALGDVRVLKLLLPPLKEQEAIAEALSDADAAIESLDALIVKKRDVKQATMQQLLTGRTRLPGFTVDWKKVPIGSFTDCKAGGTPSTSVPAYWGGNIRWMSSGELNLKRVREVSGRITELGLENSSAQLFPADSVLIGLAGQGKTRGTAAINLVSLTTNQSIAAIFPSGRHDSKFLFYVMETKYKELRDLSDGGGGRGGLNLAIIKDVQVTIPELDEQKKISEVLWSIDDELEALNEQVLKLRMVKEGMMQDLLTGKVRLV